MTRVLVVHHDLDLAGQEADSLRRFGYDVVECGGPTRNRCPVLAGRPCDLAERADVLVYDVWASGDADGARTLIENIRDVHPDTPVVLTSPGLELSWEESAGPHAVTALVGQPTGARLHEAIQTALLAGLVGGTSDSVPNLTGETEVKPLSVRAVAAVSIIVLAISACTTGQPSPSPIAAAGPTTVQVTLQEWSVVPAATSAPAGEITFQVTNTGPEDIHEFVVLKTDLDPGALPTDANGAVTEDGAGIAVVDEIEDIPVGQTQMLNVTLQAGKYVLVCNIYDETEKEAHYRLGMRTAFEVTSR